MRIKKKQGEKVKEEDSHILQATKDLREETLKTNQARVEKIKKETADSLIDESKAFMFTQRKQAATTTREDMKEWEEARKKASTDFKDKVASLKSKSKSIESSARGARKTLQMQRAREASELRRVKSERDVTARAAQEERAAATKQMVYASVNQKFVPSLSSRRMLQHPHYAEVTAVVTDITSTISKEIASSPRRRPPSAGSAAGGKAASLRMSDADLGSTNVCAPMTVSHSR